MTRANTWTPEEEAWLREVYPDHHNAEIAEMHAERFPGRPRRTAKAVNARAKVWHLRKAEGFERNPPRMWTPDKVEWFRAFVPGHTEREISAEHERLYGTPLTDGQIGNAKSKFGVRSGTTGGRFKEGCAGGFCSEEHRARFLEAGRATRFKKGEVHVAPSRERPVGFERVDKHGFTWVKVRDSRVDGIQRQEKGHHNENYRMKHHIVYEQAHGPIPEGCNVVFADRDMTNFDPANLVAVPRDLWAVVKRKGVGYHDAETLAAAVNLARLERKLHAKRCAPRACGSCGSTFSPRYPQQRTCDECLAKGLRAPKAPMELSPKGEGACAVCGAAFTKRRANQRRCEACIAAAPRASVREQRRRAE